MERIRITKEFRFDMAHALYNYNGKCSYLHGHSFRLLVTVMGTPLNDPGQPKDGMVIDFGHLKKIVSEEILNRYDHALLINKHSGVKPDNLEHPMFKRVIFFPVQPSTENLLLDFRARISPRLPENVYLHSLRLYETPQSYAEWHASDN